MRWLLLNKDWWSLIVKLKSTARPTFDQNHDDKRIKEVFHNAIAVLLHYCIMPICRDAELVKQKCKHIVMSRCYDVTDSTSSANWQRCCCANARHTNCQLVIRPWATLCCDRLRCWSVVYCGCPNLVRQPPCLKLQFWSALSFRIMASFKYRGSKSRTCHCR